MASLSLWGERPSQLAGVDWAAWPLLAATFGSLSWVPAVYWVANAGFTWVKVRFLHLCSLQSIARGQGGWVGAEEGPDPAW